MNTVAFEEFETMNAEALTTFNGGEYKDDFRCFEATEGGGIAAGTAAAIGLGLASGPIGWGGLALVGLASLGGAMGANGSADACTIQ
ncbi:hypothetical protein [Streptococcus downei]|uniref:Bacteriocin class II with double-glycine leader peptide n=1 Tax=Streptococcus downei MFe28 TaxID=764290 RepID=A0A380JCE3_STRDO|nr:hypothetical protein [Streptococcus downei]SUN35067.1 Uncharacterised protein [Streptococcus downei MFe28]